MLRSEHFLQAYKDILKMNQRKEVRTYKKKMIEALKAEEILLVDNSKANTKKKNGKRFYEIDYKRLKYFCQLQDAK